MPEKLTLSAYLAQRGKKAKALTRGEAEAFGIPWPLQAGWPCRYGAIEIMPAMIEDAKARIRAAKKAARSQADTKPVVVPPAAVELAAFPGFILRQARRYRTRKPAPWAQKKPAFRQALE